MGDSCCLGDATAIPAVPATSVCSSRGSFQHGIHLPSSCRSRTWQLVTCQENCQPYGSAPSGCEPASCQPTCLPATSCVGFVCQPICSYTACYETGTGQSPGPVSSCQPSCLESTGSSVKCCEPGPCQQSSCQECVYTSESCQAACDQSVCCDAGSCQPASPEVTSCPETSCLPTVCAANLCQPTCCHGGSCQPIHGEDQPCKSFCYQPICYILKPCQTVPCIPVPCQLSTCVFRSCSPACCVTFPCQTLHYQSALCTSFICQPAANRQPPCSVNNSCEPDCCGTVLSGQPTGGELTFCNQSGCQSPSCQPACCVTGFSKSASGGSSCFRPNTPSVCKAGTYLPTSFQPSYESSFCKATFHWGSTSSKVCCFLQMHSRGAWLWLSTNTAGLLTFLSPVPHFLQVLVRKFILRSFLIEDNLSASMAHAVACLSWCYHFISLQQSLSSQFFSPALDAAKSLRRLFCWQLLIKMCLVKHNE